MGTNKKSYIRISDFFWVKFFLYKIFKRGDVKTALFYNLFNFGRNTLKIKL